MHVPGLLLAVLPTVLQLAAPQQPAGDGAAAADQPADSMAAPAERELPAIGTGTLALPVGTWDTPPKQFPSAGTTDAPLFGNGELGVVFGGTPGQFSYNFGSNAFVKMVGVPLAAVPGGLDVSAPRFANASFAAAQHLANGTVVSTFAKAGLGILRTEAFVAPQGPDGVSLLVATLTYTAAADAADAAPLELTVAARAGPVGAADPFLVWGPCEVVQQQRRQQQQQRQQLLVARRANGEDWQDVYSGGRPTLAGYGKRITRAAVVVRALDSR
eukprot:SAG22_NODE_4574_length_1229_cov_1.119469_2_plen_272_part_00